ncbi:MAG: hypothetical protein LBH35_08215 [Treponema sp.]|jgi:hypothetical protein|nr:hypothetical protein [Treponema sp.]
MKRSFSVIKRGLGAIFLLAAAGMQAQELMPGLREQAVVLNIVARIEENSQEVWNAASSKVTIPGKPVSIRLVGTNVIVAIQFTPYLQDKDQNILVAQGQIWLAVPNEGISYKTTIQTIPLKFGEQIYFFPLGSEGARGTGGARGVASGDPRIELLIELQRYDEAAQNAPETEQGEAEQGAEDDSQSGRES